MTTLLPMFAKASSHYEDPKPNGCRSDEQAIQIQGVTGDFCTPKCSGMTCPSDVPSGVTATPTCALQDTSGNNIVHLFVILAIMIPVVKMLAASRFLVLESA